MPKHCRFLFLNLGLALTAINCSDETCSTPNTVVEAPFEEAEVREAVSAEFQFLQAQTKLKASLGEDRTPSTQTKQVLTKSGVTANADLFRQNKEWGREYLRALSDQPIKPIANDTKATFLRIPKTGSTSMVAALNSTSPCFKEITIGFHTLLRQDVGHDEICFATMREPIDRFISQWEHMKGIMFEECNENFFEIIGPSGKDFFEDALATPQTWAKALGQNATLQKMFLTKSDFRTRKDEEHYFRVGDVDFWKKCPTSMIMWKQSEWVSRETHVACYTNLQEDVSNILSDLVPACHITLDDLNVSPPSTYSIDEHLVQMVHTLYPEDFDLWQYHCG